MASKNKHYKCGLLNVQSVGNKTIEIRELIEQFKLDIFMITETWLKEGVGEDSKINEMLPDTHNFFHVPRKIQVGGGVGIFLSKQFTNIRMVNRRTYESFEHLEINFNCDKQRTTVVVLYRPPRTSITRFNEEFNDFLNLFNDELRQTYICGDFNIWLDHPNDNNVNRFIEIIECHNLENGVSEPTSRSGHTLDLIIYDKDHKQISKPELEPDFELSYFHNLITFDLCIRKHSEIYNKIIFREKGKLDSYKLIENSMQNMISRNNECKCSPTKPSDCVDCFTQSYRDVFF